MYQRKVCRLRGVYFVSYFIFQVKWTELSLNDQCSVNKKPFVQTPAVRQRLRCKDAVQQKVPTEEISSLLSPWRHSLRKSSDWTEEEVTSHPEQVLVTVLLFPFLIGHCYVVTLTTGACPARLPPSIRVVQEPD